MFARGCCPEPAAPAAFLNQTARRDQPGREGDWGERGDEHLREDDARGKQEETEPAKLLEIILR